MSAYSMEQMVLDGQVKINQLFEFVKNNAEKMDSYSMEEAIFQRVINTVRHTICLTGEANKSSAKNWVIKKSTGLF